MKFATPYRLTYCILLLFNATATAADPLPSWNDGDPKRAYLTPKRVARWYKALYMTPALFVIYSIASAKAARGYPARLRLVINLEKLVVMGLHVLLLLWLVDRGGFDLWFRVLGAPFFLWLLVRQTKIGQNR